MAATEEPDQKDRGTASSSRLGRRWLVNAGLLLFIGALAWLALHRAGQDSDGDGPPLTTAAAGSIARIHIERPDQPPITLEKNAEAWVLTAPVRARTNEFNVDRLLRLLAAPAETRFAATEKDLSQYGLARPQARVQFDGQAVALGAPHPLKDMVYVLYQNEVALIPGRHLAVAAYPYTHYIDTRLFETDRRLTAIRVPDFSVVLQKGVWTRKPADASLPSDRLNDFASEWHNARALNVEKYSGKEALDHIEITSEHAGKQEKTSLGVLAYKPNFILVRPDEQLEYHFTEEAGRRLLILSPADK